MRTEKLSDEAYELYLYADNDSQLYHNHFLYAIKSLVKKARKGVYDVAKAVKLWEYYANAAAQKYTKEFDASTATSYGAFSVKMRREMAAFVEKAFRAEVIKEAKKPGSVWAKLP